VYLWCNPQVPQRRPGGITADNEELVPLDRLKEEESRRHPSFSTGAGGPCDLKRVWLGTGDPGESDE
jgi:hypothetical protein